MHAVCKSHLNITKERDHIGGERNIHSLLLLTNLAASEVYWRIHVRSGLALSSLSLSLFLALFDVVWGNLLAPPRVIVSLMLLLVASYRFIAFEF